MYNGGVLSEEDMRKVEDALNSQLGIFKKCQQGAIADRGLLRRSG
jgi:hypothetical protein